MWRSWDRIRSPGFGSRDSGYRSPGRHKYCRPNACYPNAREETPSAYPVLNQTLRLLLFSLAAATALAAEPAELARARELFEASRLPEAQDALDGLLATEPASAEVHYYVGELALERGDSSTAVRELERSVELAPDSARGHMALVDAYGRSAEKASMFGAFGLARKCHGEYLRAVALDPASVDLHERLFEYYSRAPFVLGGGSDKAAREAAIIERIDPLRLRQAYAAVYLADGKFELALAELDKVLASAPDDYASLFQVGHVAAVSGRYLDRGLASLRRCLGLAVPLGAPSHQAAQWRLGNLLERKGDAAGARLAYQAALKLDPRFTPASEALRALNPAPNGG